MIAVPASFHRLAMHLDNCEVERFEGEHAMLCDSAKKNAPALDASQYIETLIETALQVETRVHVALWGIQKFVDTISVPVCVVRCP